ncbi:MAG: hypothetical protein AUK47_29120 [Deltaproteobacteria bacterium CG2_30_63_29]|nr:MAG: hypothetical protein AUK47_29120 [Deltaproteobacteria bacterium CG2_30_63_29]PJB49334.1 MAG: hypothetical protein CO108_00140 [Deltaproteobacteria bacterium CG_4_9_14_3_um_filter_63_12]
MWRIGGELAGSDHRGAHARAGLRRELVVERLQAPRAHRRARRRHPLHLRPRHRPAHRDPLPDGVATDTTFDSPLLTSTSWGGLVSGLLSQTYNANFNFVVVGQQLNGSPLFLAYNADLQPTAIGALALTCNTSGRLAGTTLGSVSATFQYNTYGETTQRRTKSGGIDVFVESFVTDDGGRIISATETVDGVAVTSDYAYDTAGRLTDVFVGGALRWHYEYDANSNRIAFDDFVANESASGTYDAQDRPLAYGGATFTYTENGELLTKTDAGLVTSYDCDVFGDLDAVTLPDGRTIDLPLSRLAPRCGRAVAMAFAASRFLLPSPKKALSLLTNARNDHDARFSQRGRAQPCNASPALRSKSTSVAHFQWSRRTSGCSTSQPR